MSQNNHCDYVPSAADLLAVKRARGCVGTLGLGAISAPEHIPIDFTVTTTTHSNWGLGLGQTYQLTEDPRVFPMRCKGKLLGVFSQSRVVSPKIYHPL